MKYRLINARLRVNRGPGHTDYVPERPYKKDKDGNKNFTDSEQKPTVVEFDEYCQVNIPSLLKLGAIIPLVEKGSRHV